MYDYLILGTGQATGTLLGRLIPTDKRIAVIEESAVGGSCVNYGCTPTKTLVASAKAIHQAQRGAEFGFTTGSIEIDFNRIRQRMNKVRHGSRDGLTGWMENTSNVTLIRGRGRLKDANTVVVNDTTLQARQIFINVGTHAFIPPIDGLDQVDWLDNQDLLELEKLPSHLIILGGGYIGLEFAQVFRRFGCEVTVLQRNRQLMPREDHDVATAIQEILEEEGIRIYCGTQATRVEKTEHGIKVIAQIQDKETAIQGSHLFLAVGRRPSTGNLGLDEAGIETDPNGYIKVDDFCRTSVKNVFALGDVNGHGAFTHTSVNDAEIVLDHLFGGPRRISDRRPVYALFTDPPLGRVGMTEKEALANGIRLLKATRPMAKISRAKEMSETRGFVKLLVDADTDLIIGASILGVSGDEVINMFAAIMDSGIPCRHYRRTVLVHPTISELMPWVLDGLQPV